MAPKTEPESTADDTTTADASATADERMDRLEATQREQGGMLEKILDRLPGGEPKADPASPSAPATGTADPADIQATVRREIAEANERAAAEARAKGDEEWRKHVDETLETVKAERAPREPQTGVKGKLQRAMFGVDK